MEKEAFRFQCISDTLIGLQEGLCHFSQPSRVALIYAVERDSPMRIYDPQNLLSGHEPIFKELFIDSETWREKTPEQLTLKSSSDMLRVENLQLTGLISFGGRSRALFYQMWFSEHHPDMCSISPTERWLENAAWRLSHDFANESELYTGISGSFLREYATHGIRDHLVDEMNVMLGWDTPLRIYPILDAVLGISRTLEEGAWPQGKLVFVEPGVLPEIEFLVRFPKDELPILSNFKHVRKLLQAVEDSDRSLVSNGRSIMGIAGSSMPGFHITADFRGGHGFLALNDDLVCSFCDGSFYSTTRRARLVQVEETLLETDLDPSAQTALFKIIATLVHNAETAKHGCTLVVDLSQSPIAISGQTLDPPIDLEQERFVDLARSLAKVDGALHICADLKLHAFACLLDGTAIAVENRARGARFNSALRFSAVHPDIFVVVVSSDRPVSVIQEGVEVSAQCEMIPIPAGHETPPTLEKWLAKATL
jgi:hypothetical protein